MTDVPVHDETHQEVVDAYLRDILLYDYETDDASVPDPIDVIPDDVWPCVVSSLVGLCQTTLELLAEMDGRTLRDEIVFWTTPPES